MALNFILEYYWKIEPNCRVGFNQWTDSTNQLDSLNTLATLTTLNTYSKYPISLITLSVITSSYIIYSTLRLHNDEALVTSQFVCICLLGIATLIFARFSSLIQRGFALLGNAPTALSCNELNWLSHQHSIISLVGMLLLEISSIQCNRLPNAGLQYQIDL